jgi:hypothetical protein
VKRQGNIRDVISIWKLVRKSDGTLEIEEIMKTMAKYGNMMIHPMIIISQPPEMDEKGHSRKSFQDQKLS